ncbi:hypothetical protein F5Y16DRAFT_61177 [Xylariaceae sp. FL0255]|nr:hypothetical protein F5Y16DRAFT_61177 [Xylariaceae sp. FL0255]
MDSVIGAAKDTATGIGEPPVHDEPLVLAPVTGSTLFRLEIQRREALRKKGCASTGCAEVDDAVLLGGGLDYGNVVGVSAEAIDFGMLLSLQTIACSLLSKHETSKSSAAPSSIPKAAIITTLPATTVLPMLRDVIRAQAQVKLGPRHQSIDAEVRWCLETITVSRVFDIQGLWEVLCELEARAAESLRPPTEGISGEKEEVVHNALDDDSGQERPALVTGIAKSDLYEKEVREDREEEDRGGDEKHRDSPRSPVTELPPLRIPSSQQPRVRKLEILDSEDEEDSSSSAASSPIPEAAKPTSPTASPLMSSAHLSKLESTFNSEVVPTQNQNQTSKDVLRPVPPRSKFAPDPPLPVPEIILITHFSSLLTSIFTNRDKTSAHTMLQRLSSHLRYLARSAGPLIMLLNTTTPSSAENNNASSTTTPHSAHNAHPPNLNLNPHNQHQNTAPQPIDDTTGMKTSSTKPLDPTLRSIFNPLLPHHHHHGGTGALGATSQLTRRNKPSFGATFTQFLDLHLLCTKVPRSREDAEAAAALGGAGGLSGSGSDGIKFAWVVEVLLDELGFWDWSGSGSGDGRRGTARAGREGRIPRSDAGGAADLPPPRVSREQRWGAVDVADGVRVVDAFPRGVTREVSRGPIRLAAGFGGPRV